MSAQAAILAPVPAHAVFLFADLRHGRTASDGLEELGRLTAHDDLLVGLGQSLIAAAGAEVPGLRPLSGFGGLGITTPHTPSDLVLRIAGADPGAVLHGERAILSALPSFVAVDRVLGFMFDGGRDLTGYEDGTENPVGDDADRVALIAGEGPGRDGSSVVAIQRWLHDFATWDRLSPKGQDHTIGRDRESNEELDDAPASAHVKRAAQEDFEPEAFLVRRSMPWRDERGEGLVFVSFSATLDPFEAVLRRMTGGDDGVVDALYGFTKPVTGASYWCPPVEGGLLDLRSVS